MQKDKLKNLLMYQKW